MEFSKIQTHFVKSDISSSLYDHNQASTVTSLRAINSQYKSVDFCKQCDSLIVGGHFCANETEKHQELKTEFFSLVNHHFPKQKIKMTNFQNFPGLWNHYKHNLIHINVYDKKYYISLKHKIQY